MTAEEEITFSKLDDGTNVITVKGKNFHGDTYLRQEIFKESSVYDALKRKVEASKELVEACKLALHFSVRRQMPTEHELEALSVDLRKALESHLK